MNKRQPEGEKDSAKEKGDGDKETPQIEDVPKENGMDKKSADDSGVVVEGVALG